MSGAVLILDQFNELGGAQRCLLDLLPAFSEAGFVRHVAVPGDGALADGARSRGAFVHTIPCGPYASGEKTCRDAARFGADLARQVLRITSIVSNHGINLIYVNGPRLLPAAAIGACGRRVLFHAHSIVSAPHAAGIVRWALRKSDAHVIAACRFVLEPLLSSVRVQRTSVIYNGISRVECGPRARSNQRSWRIGVIGRIAPEKGQIEFVQAARIILQQRILDHQDCQFIVCGDARFSNPEYGQRVRARAEGLPIDFIGWRDDIHEVLSGLDLLVVPSGNIDATPLVILEAFSAGVPVVAFRSGGIPELIEHGVNGVLCPPTVWDLASKILQLISDGGPCLDALADRAQKMFAARFSLDRFRAEVLDVVRRALSEPNLAY